ncbi:MAG: hypothetical protein V3S51_02815, partial [Dehalococcoidia bacterium]
MTKSLFARLKKYSGSQISQDENYATESLALLLEEFGAYKYHLVKNVFGIAIGADGDVRTQETHQTKRFGRAILDLVIEDQDNFMIIEVKIEAGLNSYEAQGTFSAQTYDQIHKYEDCIDLPEGNQVSVFVLSRHPIEPTREAYKYYCADTGNLKWHSVFASTREYCSTLKGSTAEKYLLSEFLTYLKEEHMAGFQGFDIGDLANMSGLADLDEKLDELRKLTRERISLPGFKEKEQAHDFHRDGVFYLCKEAEKNRVGIFIGLWYSDEIYDFKFAPEGGPQAFVFVEIPPGHAMRQYITGCDAYKRAGLTFKQQNSGYQVLLKHVPLAAILNTEDQATSLVDFYSSCVAELQQSGI